MQKKYKLLALGADNFACFHYRINQPYKQLAMKYNNNEKSPFEFRILLPEKQQQIPLDIFDNFNVVLLQRVIEEGSFKLLEYCKKRKKTVIMEIDDNLFKVNTLNPFFHATMGTQYKTIFRKALQMSDYIHVTTPELVELYSKELNLPKEKFCVFPNAIDLTHPRLQPSLSRRKELNQKKVVFGFNGGSSHRTDLDVLPAIFPILEECPEAIFAFCSDPHSFEYKWKSIPFKYRQQVVFIQPEMVNFDNFPNLPSMYDLGLVPLQETEFNQGKSCLKMLEYGTWNIPTISSYIPDYERFRVASNDANIIIKKNKSDKWQKTTIELIKNTELRHEMGNKARKCVENIYNVQIVNKERMKWYEEVFK